MELAAVVLIALFVAAVVSIGRATHIGLPGKVGWVAVALVLPAIGPLLWFAIGQRYAYRVSGEVRQWDTE